MELSVGFVNHVLNEWYTKILETEWLTISAFPSAKIVSHFNEL